MPLYDIYCDCGNTKEVYLKIDDEAPLCDVCGHKTKKAISTTTFILKGQGWACDGYGLHNNKKQKF